MPMRMSGMSFEGNYYVRMLITLLAALVLAWPPAAAAQTAATAIAWARVPAGTFQQGCVPGDMRCDGDEHPGRAVTITRAFEMMTTEVTTGMLRAAQRSLDRQPAWSTNPDQPATVVTWDEARAFCASIGGRLPTEAEWEYAARGGRAAARYPWGDQPPDYEPAAVNGAVFEADGARPAAGFRPNGFGLYHMAGNVWEWVADYYGIYDEGPVTDPRGPDGGGYRVVRGGSYGDDDRNLRLSNRNPNRPGNSNVNVGFRCARDIR
jgi:formylglycine-generating enzyme required for sulfatase activity